MSIGADDRSGAAAGTSEPAPSPVESAPPAEPASPPEPEGPGPRTILDGWVRYELAPGWEVAAEADGLELRRADFDRPPFVPSVGALQTLVEIRRTDGRARIELLREPAYLDVPDVDAWIEVLLDEVVGGSFDLEAEDVVQAAHGPFRQMRFEGPEGTVLVGATAFDEQRLAVVAHADADLDEAEHRELRELAAALVLDPDVRLDPMLQYHAALYSFAADGARVVDVAVDVPSDWSATEEPDGVRYTSRDQRTTVEVYVSPADGRTVEEVVEDALAFRPDRDPIIDTATQRLGDVDATVVRHGLAGTTRALDRSTSWVIVGEVDGAVVEIYLDDTRPDTDTLLLHRIFDTIEIQAP